MKVWKLESDQGSVLLLAWVDKPELPRQALALVKLVEMPLRSYFGAEGPQLHVWL